MENLNMHSETTVIENELTEDQKALIAYDLKAAALSRMLEEASKIKVTDWQDELNYEAAKEAYKSARELYNKVEKKRVALKAPILEAGKTLDAQANKIKKQIDQVTDTLQIQIDVRDKELKRQEQQKAKERADTIASRAAQLKGYGEDEAIYMLDPEACPEEKFQKILAKAKASYEVEQARIVAVASTPLGTNWVKPSDAVEVGSVDQAANAFFMPSHPIAKTERFNVLFRSLTLADACIRIIELEDELVVARQEL